MALPVFKIGRSPLTRGGWVRLPGASAKNCSHLTLLLRPNKSSLLPAVEQDERTHALNKRVNVTINARFSSIGKLPEPGVLLSVVDNKKLAPWLIFPAQTDVPQHVAGGIMEHPQTSILAGKV